MDPSLCPSLLAPCFLPGVIHFLLLPDSLGLYPKGTYRTMLHCVPINSLTRLYGALIPKHTLICYSSPPPPHTRSNAVGQAGQAGQA